MLPKLTSLLILVAVSGSAQLREIETKNLRLIFYSPNHTYLAPQLMRSFESAFGFHTKMFGYEPKGKVSILLEDFSDFGHGGADAIPVNRIGVGVAPFSTIFETVPSNERMSWMMNHELAHVFELDGTRGSDRRFRRIFGGKVVPTGDDPLSMAYAYMTVPRRYAPRWYHEGIAVFLETWMAGGLGRTLGGYDEMVFRSLVRDKGYLYELVGLEAEGTTIDFQVGVNSYLYGTRFISWLALEYGPEKVMEWARSGDGSKAYFAAQFRQVFHKDLELEWRRWIADERAWQEQNLEILRKYPITKLKRLSNQALGSVSNSFYDAKAGRIYTAVRYPGPMAHLAAIRPADGSSEHLHNVYGAALFFVCSLAYDEGAKKLFFTTENNDWRDLNVYDIATDRSKKLIEHFRAGDMTFDAVSKSLWAVQHVAGLSRVIEVPPPYDKVIERAVFPYGTDLYDLDISPDGKRIVAVIADSSGTQQVALLSVDALRAGKRDFETVKDFGFSSAAGFTFSPDGKKVYGTSYYSGASNIFSLDVETKAMEVLSNTETGLFYPRKLADGRLIAYEYTSKGFYPVEVLNRAPLDDVSAVPYFGQEIVKKYPVVKSWKVASAESVDVMKSTTRAGEFKPVRWLRPSSIYPIIQGYKDTVAYGGRMDFTDGLGLASLRLTAAYSPRSTEKAHASLDFHNFGWRVRAAYNNADFYDLFGPTKVSRKGFAGLVGQKKILKYSSSRTLDFDWSLAGYAGLERLPDFQNVAANYDKFLTGRAFVEYKRLVKTLGAVEEEKGTRWKIVTQQNIVNGAVYPRIYGQLDQGFLTPIRNSPVWIRSSAGKSFGDRDQPFANFYFGGFGNNRIDHQEVSRYREYYAFPGVKLNQIGATDYLKSLVEWNLPPKRFRSFGTSYLYCNWARVSLFSGVIGGNLASAQNRQVVGNAGAQLDMKVVIASYLNTTFSVGLAGAQDRTGRRSSEVMVSLKLQ